MDARPDLSPVLSLDWTVVERPLAGMPCNGDAAWTRVDGTRAQVAVMDGLGHGPDAAEASSTACAALERAWEQPLESKLVLMHQALRRTRGAAVALVDADLSAGVLRWCGVGNVEGLLLGPAGNERLISVPGIVGLSLPTSVRARDLVLAPDSLLLLATDGLAEGFAREAERSAAPAALAPLLLLHHARATDDALLWAGRFHA
jgi:hypothetical protein